MVSGFIFQSVRFSLQTGFVGCFMAGIWVLSALVTAHRLGWPSFAHIVPDFLRWAGRSDCLEDFGVPKVMPRVVERPPPNQSSAALDQAPAAQVIYRRFTEF